MPKQTKVCRVCGKTYESCRSIKTGSSVFNWREMCCSPECGQIYFRRVEEARNSPPKTKAKKVHIPHKDAATEAPVASESGSTERPAEVENET